MRSDVLWSSGSALRVDGCNCRKKVSNIIYGFADHVYNALNLTAGESVQSQLATKFALSGELTIQLANKPLRLSASYLQADDGMLLGVARDETTIAVSASYPIWKNLTASVGYRNTNSSIDYFDVSTPTFGIQFAAIQF